MEGHAMSITYGSSVNSIRSQHQLAMTQRSMARVMERLSTGKRINNASDDPSGLVIANGLRSKINGLNVAETNIQQGQSVLSTLESGLNSIMNLVQDFRELGVEASNGTVSDFTPYTNASSAIRDEITRISDALEFNGTSLLDGSTTSMDIQVGPDSGATSRITLGNGIFGDLDSTVLSLDNITNATTAGNAITDADAAIVTINNRLANVGGYQNRLDSATDLLQITRENYTAAESRIRDADIAAETAELTRLEVLAQAGAAMLAQANQLPAVGLSLLG
jgi:flagellin